MKPQFNIGDSGNIGGIEWRVVRGEKTLNDIVLQFRIGDSEWVKPKMAVGFLQHDFHTQAEDRLKADGYFNTSALGGGMYANLARSAGQVGWEWSAGKVEGQREQRRRREAA